jgi:hypothetical protein
MNAFRFRLQRVLDWRRTQLGIEEAKLEQKAGVVAELDRVREVLAAEGSMAETEVRARAPLYGWDLSALHGFRQHVGEQQRKIAARRAVCVEQMEAQRQKMLEARQRFRLLERLQKRRLDEWKAAMDKELEQFAAEAYLARCARMKSRQ